MKTKIISKLKKELLIIELPEGVKSWEFIDGHFFVDDKKIFIKGFTPFHKILGKPDEIKEEDVKDLVEQSIHTGLFAHYVKDIPVNTYCYKTALKSFNSALESEIYWDVNPIKIIPRGEASEHDRVKNKNEFNEAQEKTFDKKRTLIFVKN